MRSLADWIGGPPLVITLRGAQLPLAAVQGVTIRRGRSKPTDRPAAATVSVSMLLEALPSLPDVGDRLRIELSPAALEYFAAPPDAGPRFVGQLTDVTVQPERRGQPALVELVAAGPRGRLGRLTVGALPWPAELDGVRAQRILAEATAEEAALQLGLSDNGTYLVLPRDVDAQQPLALLDELSQSSGGELVETRAGLLEWHDVDHRDQVAPAAELTPEDVLAPLRWRQSLDGLVNTVTVAYGPKEGQQARLDVTDDDAIVLHGRAGASLSTVLATEADAQARGGDVVGRLSRPLWRMERVDVDLVRTVTPAVAGDLLALEYGDLITVRGFPDNGPLTVGALFVEGATETVTRAGWRLALDVSDYAATGPSPSWPDAPAELTWANVGDIRWLGAAGWYFPPGDEGRWTDAPANHRWRTTADSTWALAYAD